MHKERWWPFPIASMINSSEAVVFGQKVYGGGPNAKPIIRRVAKWFSRINNIKYWIRYRTQRKHMYHLIDTKLKPGYYDYDYRMLHGCMSLLCDYVENRYGGSEKLREHIKSLEPTGQERGGDWEREMLQSCADLDSKALEVYVWWKDIRPSEHQREADLLDSIYSGRLTKWKKVLLPGATEELYEMDGFEEIPNAPKPLGTQKDLWKMQGDLRKKIKRCCIS